MVLSQKEKEAAKMGLPVFTVSFFLIEATSWVKYDQIYRLKYYK